MREMIALVKPPTDPDPRESATPSIRAVNLLAEREGFEPSVGLFNPTTV